MRQNPIEDLGYIVKKHFIGADLGAIKTPSRPIQAKLRQTILNLFGYSHCDGKAKVELEKKALRIARLTTLPLHILRESLQDLTCRRSVAPGYRFMQDMVGRVVARERKRITDLLEQALTTPVEKQLDKWLCRIKDFSNKNLQRNQWCFVLENP